MVVNFKNLSENLIIVIVCVSLGGVVGYKASTKAHQKAIEAFTPTIEKAIDKETIKNEIKNEINIAKIKKVDTISITLDPTNNQKPINVISGKDCIPLSKLSDREKRKLRKSGEL